MCKPAQQALGYAVSYSVSSRVIRTGASFEARLVEAVKRKREAEGLSIRALAGIVGVSFSSLARIERGEGLPDNNSKIRLLEWLGPDANEAGLAFDQVALVHFRAGKNVRSSTVHTLLRAAERLRQEARDNNRPDDLDEDRSQQGVEYDLIILSKEELENIAQKFRQDLGLKEHDSLDSLRLEVEGVTVVLIGHQSCLDAATVRKLKIEACHEWSAMTVPLNRSNDKWIVLLNDCHTVERQRVTILEEFWHILLGHKLTRVARVADAYGRTYDQAEEHDAYYLASACLLPKRAMIRAVEQKLSSEQTAQAFGTSPELVDYRLKRLGLWREHVAKRIALLSK
jgi:Zn-dependent peptidase ImmA (M78 family)